MTLVFDPRLYFAYTIFRNLNIGELWIHTKPKATS